MSPPHPRLILASGSPRRQQLLHKAGYAFDVRPSDVDEDDHPPRILPAELAQYLAVQKATAVARRFPEDVVLAADTVVALGDRPLGKPVDADDARRMLELLSGTTHIVITGVAVLRTISGYAAQSRVMSAVRMRALTSDEIASTSPATSGAARPAAMGSRTRTRSSRASRAVTRTLWVCR